jgi:hypothetical protein
MQIEDKNRADADSNCSMRIRISKFDKRIMLMRILLITALSAFLPLLPVENTCGCGYYFRYPYSYKVFTNYVRTVITGIIYYPDIR